MSSTKDILIYSPNRYIVGKAYGLHRMVNEKPYKGENIIGILKSYSETELTFVTLEGKISVCTQNFDNPYRWNPRFCVGDENNYYSMYGLSINEEIIDSTFTVGCLYVIKDKLNKNHTWYGIYGGHKLDIYGEPYLKFKNVNTGDTDVSISKILRKEVVIYTIEAIREIKFTDKESIKDYQSIEYPLSTIIDFREEKEND